MELDNITVLPLRQRVRILMEDAVCIPPPSQWEAFKRVWNHFNFYFVSQLVLCDGTTVDPSTLLTTKTFQHQSKMIFQKEEPTCAGFLVWHETTRLLTLPISDYHQGLENTFKCHIMQYSGWHMKQGTIWWEWWMAKPISISYVDDPLQHWRTPSLLPCPQHFCSEMFPFCKG